MNPFKQTIWSNFWAEYTDIQTEIIIELLVKEAVEKLPHHKIQFLDKLKIRRIDLDFTDGRTLLQLNDCTNIINIGPINNMTCFVSLMNIETISISYFNPRASLDDNNELSLETSVKETNLFKSFKHLEKVELTEKCKDGIKKVDVNRKDVLY